MRRWKSEHPQESLVVFLFGIAILVGILFLTSCETTRPPADVLFWAGDFHHSGVTRSQAGQRLSCGDPQFDEYVCMTYKDLKDLYQTLNQCQD